MKKTSVILRMVLTAVLLVSFSLVPITTSAATTEVISLVSEDSGYKISVPGFIDVKEVTVEDSTVTVAVVETPSKDSNGKYPIFEIITTDKSAYRVESFPGIMNEGQAGNFEGTFSNGKLTYAPSFAFTKELKDVAGDNVFSFDFNVYDKDGNPVYSVVDLNFMFVNKSTPEAPKNVTVPAKPTSSKVVVNGKQVPFEAYSINGSNYFKLRDLAMAINGSEKQFEIGWDSAENAINLTSETAYTPVGNELTVSGDTASKNATLTSSKIYLDGNEIQLTVYNIGGSNYFKLRDIGNVIDFGVTWDGQANMIGIDTSTGYTE